MTAIDFDHTYARLPEAFFARVRPAQVPSPKLLRLNRGLAEKMDLDPEWLQSAAGVAMLSGNALPESADPIAMAYAGHQFGGWSPQLGDGRAILLGELVGRDGIRRDLQLKGAGRTPFSRQGDGKSPLGPVVREFVVSEAMAALGIPTTRALAAVATGEEVFREGALPGGVLARVAQSHVRVGTFEFFHGRGEVGLLRELADYIIDRHYPSARDGENAYAALLGNVVRRQADLIARWMQVGFIHGVMNTDNMQIVGETIDFGPCAFMEEFDVGTVLSSIDQRGRYAWGNQPGIGQWNLTRLAESLLPLLAEAEAEEEAIEIAQSVLAEFSTIFNERFLSGFCEKLGIDQASFSDDEAALAFLNQCFTVLKKERVDFTLFFRELSRVAHGAEDSSFLDLFDDRAAGEAWRSEWRGVHAGADGGSQMRADRMRGVNPIFIARNHRVEEAIEAAMQGDMAPFDRLVDVLAKPFEEQPENAAYALPAAPNERVTATFCGT